MKQKMADQTMGYDFIVQYKKRPENRVTKVLSRKEDEEIFLALLSVPTVEWMEEVKQGYKRDPNL